MSKAKLKRTGTVYNFWKNDTGEEHRGLDGLSGPYCIPVDGYVVSASFHGDGGYWHETIGLSAEEFARDFEEMKP